MPAEFHRLLKQLRLQVGYGLREFAELIGDAPSNYAGVESGARPPWRTEEKLRKAAKLLMLEEGSVDWRNFFDLGRRADALPLDMQGFFESTPMAMQLMRTVNERRLTEAELRAVDNYIRRKFKRPEK